MRLEIVAEVGSLLFPHLLGIVFAALLWPRTVMKAAQATDVQWTAAGGAFLGPAQRQGQRCQGCSATPAKQFGIHVQSLADTAGLVQATIYPAFSSREISDGYRSNQRRQPR